MTRHQIQQMIAGGNLPGIDGNIECIETHISWVILSDQLVFKIKKPVRYSFLDFSTLDKRKFYCEREVLLNNRFSKDLYLGVSSVKHMSASYVIDVDGNSTGDIIDFAVRMRRLNSNRQMNVLLANNQVSETDIEHLASAVASFHQSARRIFQKDIERFKSEYNDLGSVYAFVHHHAGPEYGDMIRKAIQLSDVFIGKHKQLFEARLHDGYFRDCHGDLHSRNIFLLPEPQLFDCIEFNDDYREIDLLNEVAFLCMDLDVMGREDLSAFFLKYYTREIPVTDTKEEGLLFIYYKSYRANVRAKVNSLRAISAESDGDRNIHLTEAKKYLRLLNVYISQL